jgi:hypothetical protein
MGVLDTYNNSNFGRMGGFGGGGSSGGGGGGGSIGGGINSGYTSIGQVVDAYVQGKISYREAYSILMNEFNLSDNDINDVLIEEQKPPKPPPGTPDDSEDEEDIPDTSTDTNDPVIQSVGLTDDQRFMLIGLVVLGGILGFIKK